MSKTISIIIFTFLCSQLHAQIINTFAGIGPIGAGSYGGDGGPATAAHLNGPYYTTSDCRGNLYIGDDHNRRIRKVNSSGIITTIAGTGAIGHTGDGGPATAALISVSGIKADAVGNIFFVNYQNYTIRKIDTNGIITTVAGNGSHGFSGDGGPATLASLGSMGGSEVQSVCLDKFGNLYIVDFERIRKVDLSGIITTIAGTGFYAVYTGEGGPATTATIAPNDIVVDSIGNVYFIGGYRICKIDTNGLIHTIAGNGSPPPPIPGTIVGDGGPATDAEIQESAGITLDGAGNIYFTEVNYSDVRFITSSGILHTYAGNAYNGFSGDGGPATVAQLQVPTGLSIDVDGNLYIGDVYNNRVRIVSSPDKRPVFTGGHLQYLSICENVLAYPINSILAVVDSDTAQNLHWSIVRSPAHGALVALYNAASTGGLVIPVGLSITPTTGYLGYDTFKVRITDGIKSDTTTVYVTIYPQPDAGVITGPLIFCTGGQVTLTDTTSGGVWQVSNSLATITMGGVVTSIIEGFDTAFYTVTNSCATDTAFYPFVVFPSPTPGIITGKDTICAGNTDTLTVTASGLWSITNSLATITPLGVVTGVNAGRDTVIHTVVNDNGCTAKDTFSIVVLSKAYCDSINEVQPISLKEEFNVYPNPATYSINITFNFAENAEFIVTDMVGKKVAMVALHHNGSPVVIRCADWARGVYMYRVLSNGHIEVGKLVLE